MNWGGEGSENINPSLKGKGLDPPEQEKLLILSQFLWVSAPLTKLARDGQGTAN